MTFLTNLCALLAGVPCATESFDAAYLMIGNHPHNDADGVPIETGWSDEAQGLAHDDDHWFLTQNSWGLIPHRPTLWKVPVEVDLETGNSAWINLAHSGVIQRTLLEQIPALAGYDRLRDLDHHDGFLFVGVEDSSGVEVPAIAAFEAATLAFRGHASVGQVQTNSHWCAISPCGHLFTSGNQTQQLNKFRIDWQVLLAGGPLVIGSENSIGILDQGSPLLLDDMEGGVFSPNGDLLYLAMEKEAGPYGGIVVVDTATWTVVANSDQHGYPFDYTHAPFSGEEVQGLTYWDLDDGRAPGMGGQLHALLLDTDTTVPFIYEQYGDVSIKHYTHTLRVDPTWTGTQKGTPDQPFQTIPGAAAIAWDGARICVPPGTYTEPLQATARVRVGASCAP